MDNPVSVKLLRHILKLLAVLHFHIDDRNHKRVHASDRERQTHRHTPPRNTLSSGDKAKVGSLKFLYEG